MLTLLTGGFVKTGDTGFCVDENNVLQGSQWFGPTNTPNDTRTFNVPISFPGDEDPIPQAATAVRFIVTACGRYPAAGPDGVALENNSFPVAMVEGYPEVLEPGQVWPNHFTIRARNSDTAAQGGYASFMWLVITEGGTRTRKTEQLSNPMNQIFIGQPAPFPATNHVGDHQYFPNLYDPPAGPFLQEGLYNFNGIFGTAQFPVPQPGQSTASQGAEPLVFATANSLGVGGPGAPAHTAAAVPRVATRFGPPLPSPPDITPEGFQLIARNSDTAAGLCGFNWAAFQQFPAPLTANQAMPADLWVDTGRAPQGFEFVPGGWASAEIQFSAPFNTVPVVLITPRVEAFAPGGSSCAPVPIAQNVTPFGFTLAARNSDTNVNASSANFDWVALAPAP
jgi:hypothetical protein